MYYLFFICNTYIVEDNKYWKIDVVRSGFFYQKTYCTKMPAQYLLPFSVLLGQGHRKVFKFGGDGGQSVK